MKKKENHTTIRNGKLFCMNCGRDQDMHLPIEVDMASAMMIAFAKIHKKCEPIWKEPVVNPNADVLSKANFWYTNGQRGSSSEAMWHFFMGKGDWRKDPPWDPDDFSRCYKLLEMVPEWKSRIPELKNLSPVWSKLADNWHKLTEMYEENKRTDWKNYKAIGMGDFMRQLTDL